MSSMNWSIIIIPIAVASVFAILARFFPASSRAKSDRVQKKTSKMFQTIFGVSLFGLWLPITAGIAWLLHSIYQSLGPRLSPDDLVLFRCGYLEWLVSSMFLALLVCGWLLERIAKSYWPEEYAAYTAAYISQSEVDWKRIERPVVVGTVSLSLLLALLMWDFGSRFTNDRLVANPFFGIGAEEHFYSDLEQITYYDSVRRPDGKDRFSPQLILHFRDGYSWESRWGPGIVTPDVLQSLTAELSEISGVHVEKHKIKDLSIVRRQGSHAVPTA